MSDIREQLARRMLKAWSKTDQPWEYVVADECLRQMEWARTLHGERWVGEGWDGTRRVIDLDDEPLTLAPDDWKP